MTLKTKGVFDIRPAAGGRLEPVPASINGKIKESYGFDASELYADTRVAFVSYEEALESAGANFAYPDRMKRSARALIAATPETFGACSPLRVNRALVEALIALDVAERNGDLPDVDMVQYHRSELRGLHERLAAMFPNLILYRDVTRNDRMTLPDSRARAFLDDLLRETAADAKVAAPSLAEELRASAESLSEAEQATSPAASDADRKAAMREPLKSAVAQAIPVWNWLTNAAQKLRRAGVAAKDAEEAIRNYSALAQRLAGAAEFFKWLSSWWY